MERRETCRATGRVLRGFVLMVLAGGMCAGGTCSIEFADPSNPGGTSSYVPLDEAEATITIRQSGESDQAVVAAWITGRFGLPLRLQEGQAIAVNGELLSGPALDGTYACEVPVADGYTVTVSEPTRGVLETTIGSPAGFAITAPSTGGAASLSGFTLTWSSADPELEVVITLAQTLFGEEQTQEFGPFTDTGSQRFGYEDLADFRQGAPLLIGVTRINQQEDIAGFDRGTLSVEHSESIAVEPAP